MPVIATCTSSNHLLCCYAGHEPSARRQIAATFAAIAREHGGVLNRFQAMKLLAGLTGGVDNQQEATELLWTEMGLAPDAQITQVLSRNEAWTIALQGLVQDFSPNIGHQQSKMLHH